MPSPPLWLCNWVHCVCFELWPFNLSFLSFFFFDCVGILWPQLSSVKTCALDPLRPLSLCVPAVAGHQLVQAAAYASDSGDSLHCFLAGVIKTYSNRWLVTLHSFFQPASLTPHPAPLQLYQACSWLWSSVKVLSLMLFGEGYDPGGEIWVEEGSRTTVSKELWGLIKRYGEAGCTANLGMISWEE